jgi:hypothetical protein
MVDIKRQQKRLAGRSFIPSVIEPSFGIGRILYCVFEHCYYTREARAGRRALGLGRFGLWGLGFAPSPLPARRGNPRVGTLAACIEGGVVVP